MENIPPACRNFSAASECRTARTARKVRKACRAAAAAVTPSPAKARLHHFRRRLCRDNKPLVEKAESVQITTDDGKDL